MRARMAREIKEEIMQTNNMPRGHGGKPAAQLLTEPVYICGKTIGIPNAPYEFRNAKIALARLGWKSEDIYNPVEMVHNAGMDGAPSGDIAEFLEPFLLQAGTLCRLLMWKNSARARAEHAIAVKHGMVIVDLLPETGQIKLAEKWLEEKED